MKTLVFDGSAGFLGGENLGFSWFLVLQVCSFLFRPFLLAEALARERQRLEEAAAAFG